MGAELSQQPEQAGPDGGAGPVLPGSHQPNVPVAPSPPFGANAPMGANTPLAPGVNFPTGNGAQEVSEGVLLTQLVQLLHQRPRSSLLLSDLGALLPQNLRSSVKEKGGLRSWLQKHPMLFQVTGQPGKESVILIISSAGQEQAGGMQAVSHQAENKVEQVAARKDEEDEDNASCVQLRGLPYRATVADVKTFLGRHAAFLKDEHAIQLVLNRDGRPSGFARVHFRNPNAARAARDELHNAVMSTQENGAQDRYVEIFLYSERPNKLKFRKGIVSDGSPPDEEVDIQGMSKEMVIQECREHMKQPGKSQLLLSMLGVALSPAARSYLKKTDLGLKHFLAQYPQEFGVEGQKGREQITYLPEMPKGYTMPDPTPVSMPTVAPQSQSVAADGGKGRNKRGAKPPPGPVTGNINDLMHNGPAHIGPVEENLPFGLTSPMHNPVSPGMAARGMKTPSDWGTPHPEYEPWETSRKQKAADSQTPKPISSDQFQPGQTPNVFDTPNWALWGISPWGPSPTGGMPGVAANPSLPWLGDNPLTGGMAPGMTPSVAELLAGMQPPGIGPATQPSMMQPPGIAMSSSTPQMVETSDQGNMPEGQDTVALRLRGLPYQCSEQDIFAFFAKHDMVEQIADVAKAVKLLPKPNGKPSGQAIIEMASSDAAELARSHINGQWMGTRYVEVFYNDEFERHEGANNTNNATYGAVPNEPMEIQGMSDTGGSGGMPATTVPPYMLQPQQSGQQWSGATNEEVSNYMAMANANRAEALARQSAGGTGGEAMLKDQGESSWEALFDFLKRDNQQPQQAPNLRTASM